MKYQLIVYLFVITTFAGCKSSIEKEIARKASDCDDENCKIKITDFTDFQWDKMYIFNYAVPSDEVDQAIGVEYGNYEEFTRPWVFVKNNKIVYAENNPDDIETIVDREVVFDGPDSLRFMVYTPKKAIFRVKKKTSDRKNYYLLY